LCSGLMGSDLRFGSFRVCGRLSCAAAVSRGRHGREVAREGQGRVLIHRSGISVALARLGSQRPVSGGPPSTRWRRSRGSGRRAARWRGWAASGSGRWAPVHPLVSSKGPRASAAGGQLGGGQLAALARLGSQRQRPAGPRPTAGDALGRGPEHRRPAGSSAAGSSAEAGSPLHPLTVLCEAAGGQGAGEAGQPAAAGGSPSTRWRRSRSKGP